MTALLSPADAAQLRKFVAMFDSDNDGERSNALSHAKRVAERHGMRLAECLVVKQPLSAERPIPPAPASPWRPMVTACRATPHLFTGWERSFLADIEAKRALSAKQLEILARLHAKAESHLASRASA